MNAIKHWIKIMILSLVIGLLAGIITVVFGRVLLWITEFRSQHVWYLLPFLPFVGWLIIWLYQKWGKDSQKGMSLLFETYFNEREVIPKRLLPLVTVTTWLTHLFGGSAGREGVAVQIGGTIGYFVERKAFLKGASNILLIAGMAAGFGGLFQTPVAATFFALEVFVIGQIAYSALVPALLAAFTASQTSHYLGLEKFQVPLNIQFDYTASNLVKLAFAGILFGLTGWLFSVLLKKGKQWASAQISDPLKRIFLFGIGLTVLLLVLFAGRYAGLGTNLIDLSLKHGTVYPYDWILKLLLTIFTLSIGFQGGEVTPLFAIGATLGVLLGQLLGLPVTLIAALGYAAVFSSATNTYLAGIFIGGEVFGYQALPLFVIVITFAYAVNQNQSIYSLQKLANKKVDHD